MNTYSLDQDQAGLFVWPVLAPNCLQRATMPTTKGQNLLEVFTMHCIKKSKVPKMTSHTWLSMSISVATLFGPKKKLSSAANLHGALRVNTCQLIMHLTFILTHLAYRANGYKL